ncbi:MAG: hypothetical protein K1X72_25740 [Pyrinomonadaceae bacterium]|nr:hypothetical protein [Pyrinomonadaceae bacterium]
MRKILILISLMAAFVLFSNEANAQTKKRIGLEEGADSVQVKGKITGKQYALYEIYVSKGDSWDVKLTSSNDYIGYTVKAPNGDKYDFLEAAPVEGYYIIRVELNSRGAKSKKTADFTLDIKFEMASGKPIG